MGFLTRKGNLMKEIDDFIRDNKLSLLVKKNNSNFNFVEIFPGGQEILFRLRNFSDEDWTIDVKKGRGWETIPFQGSISSALEFLKENFPWLLY